VNVGSFSPHAPPALPALEPGPDFDELSSCTSSTPSIKRKRPSATATADWLTVQPVIVIVGTLPAGVAEVDELVLAVAVDDPPLEPTVPWIALRETSAGNTRPTS
jgi:hypothetical protein